uniref:MC028L n=1 Tax=Rousettus bat poxvirus TaxID=3141933 RepID=A0AAU7E2C3_9POXV
MPHIPGRRFRANGSSKKDRVRPKAACPCPSVPGVDSLSEASDTDAPARAPAKPEVVRAFALPPPPPPPPRVAASPPSLPVDEPALGGEPASLLEQIVQFAESACGVPPADIRALAKVFPVADVYRVVNTVPARAHNFYVSEAQLAPGVFHCVHRFHHARSVCLLVRDRCVDVTMSVDGRAARARLDERTPSLECGGVHVTVTVHRNNIEAKAGESTLVFYSRHLLTVDGSARVLLAHEKLVLVKNGVLVEAEHD